MKRSLDDSPNDRSAQRDRNLTPSPYGKEGRGGETKNPCPSKLSIVIPVLNEAKTIQEILDRIQQVELPNRMEKEILIVNDCSRDNTDEVIRDYIRSNPEMDIFYLCHERNQGKGAALRTGIGKATGDYLVIQDADLEYEPKDYRSLLEPLLRGEADVVYGSRFLSNDVRWELPFWHAFVNRFLTFLSNLFTGLRLTDMETCYKMFRTEVLKGMELKENRFGFEPEVTAKLSRFPNIRIQETGISYHPRNRRQGKKIGWKDGLRTLYCILKYNLMERD